MKGAKFGLEDLISVSEKVINDFFGYKFKLKVLGRQCISKTGQIRYMLGLSITTSLAKYEGSYDEMINNY